MNRNQFKQYIEEEHDFEPIEDKCDEEKVRSSSYNESANFPSFSYSVSSGDEPINDRQDDYEDAPTGGADAVNRTKSIVKGDKVGNPKHRSIHQEVLMASALSAVMETSEDGLVWFDDADRKSLLSEPGELARNRIARMREFSRSESSLFNEHGQIEVKAGDATESKTEKEANPHEDMELLETKAVATSVDILEPVALRRSSNVMTTPYKRGHNRSKSDQMGISKTIIDVTRVEDGSQEDKLSMSAPNATVEETSMCSA